MEQILVMIHSGACWDFFLRHHPIVKTNGSSCLQCHFGGGNVLCVVSTWMKQINPCYTLSPATDFALLGWLTSSFEWMPSMLPKTIFSMCIVTQPTRGAKGYAIAPHPIFGKVWFKKKHIQNLCPGTSATHLIVSFHICSYKSNEQGEVEGPWRASS